MLVQSRPLSRLCAIYVTAFFLMAFVMMAMAGTALAAEKQRLRADDYQIAVELLPETHKLSAHAVVKVTALEDLSLVSFQLNNALRVTKLVDANNKPLTPERVTQDSSIRFGLNGGLSKGSSTTFTFLTSEGRWTPEWPPFLLKRWPKQSGMWRTPIFIT